MCIIWLNAFPSKCLIATRCRFTQKLVSSDPKRMNDQMLGLRDDVWALCWSGRWGVKYSCFFPHFTGRCGWVEPRHLIPCGFEVVFQPVWLLMSRQTHIVDTSLNFTFDQTGRIKDIHKDTKQFCFKVVKSTERSGSEGTDVCTLNSAELGTRACRRHRAKTFL